MSATAHPGRGWKIAAAVLIVVAGIWAGARVHSGRSDGSDGRNSSSSSTEHLAAGPPAAVRVPVGEASPPTSSDFAADVDLAPPAAAKIPERLPAFSLSDRAGKTTSIASWGGKSLILNFWATWCAPCRREIPLLKTLSSEWSGRDVEVVGVAVDHRDNVVAYADELRIPYPILIGEQDALDVAASLGVESPVFPFTVFTDRRGQIITLYVGELHKAQADLILSVVQDVNDHQVALPEARRSIAEGLRALKPGSPG